MFPTTTPPDLEDYQLAYGDLILGALTPYGSLTIEGLDLAEIRSGDVGIPRDHGQFMGLDVYGGRDIIIDTWMKANDESLQSSQLALAAVTTVKSNEEQPLWFKLPNLPVMCVMCRPRKRPMKIDSDYAAANIGKPEIQLHATDPRIYGAPQFTAIAWGSEDSPTTVDVDNTGNTEMRPVLVFTGPLIRPTIKSETLGAALTFSDQGAERELLDAKLKVLLEELLEWNRELEKEEITEEEFETKREAYLTEKAQLEKEYAEHTLGEPVTVQDGDQLYVNLGTPHLIKYYKDHTGKVFGDAGENVADWLTPDSVWWDILPLLVNDIQFWSEDASDPGGSAEIQWAPATQL